MRYGGHYVTSTTTFVSLGLSIESLKLLEKAKYTTPTPIQQKAIPHALKGADVIGCAATGTGKTAAFILPTVERIQKKPGIKALVLAPTRELANQIAEHAANFGSSRGIVSCTVIGGVSMGPQVSMLKRANLVIATPGRLVDHLNQGNLNFDSLEVLILDEADRMLDMGFKPQLKKILARLPKKRQTLLFSATMAGEVAEFAKTSCVNPVRVEVNSSGTTAARATQQAFDIGQNEKNALLLALLSEDEASTLVFTRTKRRADKLAKVLTREGHTVERIHADRSQNQRQYALQGFKTGKFRVLVATDIAARGIDVADIGHVVNFDLPHVPEDYVHRIGRTARAAASGRASAFVSPDEVPLMREIEKLTKTKTPKGLVPREGEVFIKAMIEEKTRQANPGPRAHSPRREGQPMGRHARTHQKRSS
jgi:ATP-dependent RNA helicase RhlE